MPHYRATPESHATIDGDGLLLIDSGAQYLGGTTDITRVWPIGTLSDGAAARRTRSSCKGTIALSARALPARHAVADARRDRARTALGERPRLRPRHRPRRRLLPQRARRAADDLARRRRADDGDGAGHDHQRSSPACTGPAAGACGSRTWSSTCRRPAATSEFGEFLEFETLTLCPIDTRCIDRALLRADEIAWLNAYHATVRERLAPGLAGAALDWLRRRTAPI